MRRLFLMTACMPIWLWAQPDVASDRDPELGVPYCSVTFKILSSAGHERPYRIASMRLDGPIRREYSAQAKKMSIERIPCYSYRVRLEPRDTKSRGHWAVTDGTILTNVHVSGPRKALIVLRAPAGSYNDGSCVQNALLHVQLRNLNGNRRDLWCELIPTVDQPVYFQQAPIEPSGMVTFADVEEGFYLLTVRAPGEVVAVAPVFISFHFGRRQDSTLEVDVSRYLAGPLLRHGIPEETARQPALKHP